MSDIFKNMHLDDDEREFISKIKKQYGEIVLEQENTLATFYLAKQIEKASKSSDKSSRAMTYLTGAIALFTLCQVLIAIFK